MTESVGRRLFQLVEPVAVVTYMANEPTEAVMALGLRNVWDAYFAGRAAPLGRDVPPEVVHALFYNFADGEVARHIPRVWDTVTPEAANAAREQGSVAALRRILGDLADSPGVARAGRPRHQGGDQRPDGGTGPLRRGADAARAHRTGGAALARGQPAPRAPRRRPRRRTRDRGHRRYGGARAPRTLRGHAGRAVRAGLAPAPSAQLAAVVDGMRARGLVGADGWLTAAGRQIKERVETLTDELAAPAYDILEPDELDQLVEDLEPLAAVLVAAGSQ